ncbi:uncharacterized protein Dwil_GK20809 [Drosophila willistoni]|uniref:Gp150 n=1 Tax=Drosophila willistoni TaxID=7260 RepID=B4MJH3_DROWI|nr:uncharacterized protein Dwil_GK20809 [Drosophila willistoni]
MGRRQLGLVLLLLVCLEASLALTPSGKPAIHLIHDDLLDNELTSGEEDVLKHGIKISTPKIITKKTVKEQIATTPAKPQVVSDETFKDLLEASKHSVALAEDPRFNKMLPDRLKNETLTSPKNATDSNYEYDEYNYDDDYNYDNAEEDLDIDESKETTTITSVKAKGKKTNKSTSKTTTTAVPKLQAIEESTSVKSKVKNTIDNDNDGDDDNDDNIPLSRGDLTDDEQVVFSENVPCPRYCVCSRNVNSYLVATCSRLDSGQQKFGSDITDLVVTNVGPKYPILLGPKFFHQLGLKTVSSIKIANCTIEYMHPEAFHGLEELYAVNLTDVGLAIINPNTFTQNKKLRMLTISGNDLSVMSTLEYLLKSSTIEELDISRNNLMELNPTAFKHLSNIVYINLAQNALQKIPEKVFDSVTTIEELDLSYNALKELPKGIFNRTKSLSILHLKYNSFAGDLHFGINELQQLDLSFNVIVQVHHSMFDKMPGLTNLNLRGNGIIKISPDSFLTLKNLRHIDLSINELDQVSSMLFFKNSELDVIRLNDNPRLSQLPTDGFISYNGDFTAYFLDISNCAIGALGHNTFSTMPHLTTLKLAWNNINNLPRETFASLRKLVDLDLSNNLISKLDELIFMENNELSKLNLAGNPLVKLSMRIFLPLQQLKSLDVNDCELTTLLSDRQFGKGYKVFDTLRTFNASGNLIRRISKEDVQSFKNLRSLDLSKNPLDCTADFQDFISYVSLHTKMMPKRMPLLANLEDDEATIMELETRTQASWAQLAHKVCDNKEKKLELQLEEGEKKLDEDEKLLSVLDKSVLDKSRLSSMQKIMKGSPATEDAKLKVTESAEEDSNHGGEQTEDDYDSEEEDGDDEDDDDSDDDDDDEDAVPASHEKQADINDLDTKLIFKDHGVKVEEIDLSKETTNKKLQDKLRDDSDEEDSSEQDEEEIIIERGRIYYSGYRFMFPIIIVVTCLLIILLGIAKVVSMVLRKRGERYRMALLASKNSFVYQKLSEDIVKPLPSKEPKQPKVHRYAPINQV